MSTMKAWKNAASYSPGPGGVQAWLVMMARSVAIDWIRLRRARFEAASLAIENVPEPVSREVSPEEQTVRGQRHPRIHSVHGNVLLLVAGRNKFVRA